MAFRITNIFSIMLLAGIIGIDCGQNAAKLKNAKRLILEANKKDLESISLSNMFIEELPEQIRFCASAKTVNLSGNRLSTLPAWMGELYGLKFLDASRNRINSLPRKMFPNALSPVGRSQKLENLEELHLSDNEISSLPDEFGYLRKLKMIDLSNNKITLLPRMVERFAENEFFELLDLTGNPISDKSNDESFLGGDELKRIFGNKVRLPNDEERRERQEEEGKEEEGKEEEGKEEEGKEEEGKEEEGKEEEGKEEEGKEEEGKEENININITISISMGGEKKIIKLS